MITLYVVAEDENDVNFEVYKQRMCALSVAKYRPHFKVFELNIVGEIDRAEFESGLDNILLDAV